MARHRVRGSTLLQGEDGTGRLRRGAARAAENVVAAECGTD